MNEKRKGLRAVSSSSGNVHTQLPVKNLNIVRLAVKLLTKMESSANSRYPCAFSERLKTRLLMVGTADHTKQTSDRHEAPPT